MAQSLKLYNNPVLLFVFMALGLFTYFMLSCKDCNIYSILCPDYFMQYIIQKNSTWSSHLNIKLQGALIGCKLKYFKATNVSNLTNKIWQLKVHQYDETKK